MSYDTSSWFGFGSVAEYNNNLDVIANVGGLDWSIEKEPVNHESGGVMDNRFVLTRSDTGKGLEVVSKNYEIFQPRDMLEYAGRIAKESGGIIEAAGALKGGRMTFAAVNFGSKQPIKGDEYSQYFLLFNGNDAAKGVTVSFLNKRLWCQNMIRLALSGSFGSTISLRHSGLLQDELQSIVEMMEQRERYEEWENMALHELVDFRMTESNLLAYAMATVTPESDFHFEDGRPVFEVPEEFIPTETMATRRRNQVQEIMNLTAHGKGHQELGIANTAYGAFQAVAEYVDHRREDESGLYSAYAGAGLAMKDRAFNVLAEMVEMPAQQFAG